MTNYKYKDDQGLKCKILKVRDPSQSLMATTRKRSTLPSYPKPFVVYMPNGSGHTVRGEGPTCKAKPIAKSKTPDASKAVKLISRTRIWESRKSTSLGSVAQGFLSTPTLTNH